MECVSERQDVRKGEGPGVWDRGKYSKEEIKKAEGGGKGEGSGGGREKSRVKGRERGQGRGMGFGVRIGAASYQARCPAGCWNICLLAGVFPNGATSSLDFFPVCLSACPVMPLPKHLLFHLLINHSCPNR